MPFLSHIMKNISPLHVTTNNKANKTEIKILVTNNDMFNKCSLARVKSVILGKFF